MSGPCLCGDPWCVRCFPRTPADRDPDEEYEIARQKEIDDAPLDEAPVPPSSPPVD